MLKFISNHSELEFQKSKFQRIFKPDKNLPENIFLSDYLLFTAFEFDLIYDQRFFEGLINFLKYNGDTGFTFYTIAPSPEAYFFKHFSKYSIVEFPLSTSYSAYVDLLHEDPGNSLADALLHNAGTITLFSHNLNWGVIGDKDWEIAIVGFKDDFTKNLFLTSFDKEIWFSSIAEQSERIEETVKLTDIGKQFFFDMGNNYK